LALLASPRDPHCHPVIPQTPVCRGVPGEHVVLRLDESLISHPVKYEAPAPVGSTAAPENPTLFPHIYGPVQKSSVVATLKVQRAADGSFLSFDK
jgi:uncharacterized protein (DUF952 family)